MNDLVAARVEEVAVPHLDVLCLQQPPHVQFRAKHGDVACNCEKGHVSSHVSNPYYDLVTGRHESLVWGIDEKDGYAYSYTIDLEALEKDGRRYTLAEILAELGRPSP